MYFQDLDTPIQEEFLKVFSKMINSLNHEDLEDLYLLTQLDVRNLIPQVHNLVNERSEKENIIFKELEDKDDMSLNTNQNAGRMRILNEKRVCSLNRIHHESSDE